MIRRDRSVSHAPPAPCARFPRRGRLPFTAGLLSIALAATSCNRGDRGATIAVSGHIEATEVRISSQVPGRVARFGLQEGDTVGVGQEVARLDTRDLTLAADAARADRDLAAANLRLLVAGARAEEIAEAEANVARQVADLHSAESDLGRVEGLVEAGSGTDKARDDARARRDMSAGALRAAEERLKRFRAGSRPEELDAARARLAAAEARAAGAASQLADAVTASPVAGVLTAKLVEAGEWVMPGAVIAVVTDLAHPWLNVFLGETDLGRIRIGQTVEVATDDGQMRTGRVSYIASSAEFTPRNVQTREERVKLVYRVKIAMDNADGLFKPGMPAEARLTVAPRAGRS